MSLQGYRAANHISFSLRTIVLVISLFFPLLSLSFSSLSLSLSLSLTLPLSLSLSVAFVFAHAHVQGVAHALLAWRGRHCMMVRRLCIDARVCTCLRARGCSVDRHGDDAADDGNDEGSDDGDDGDAGHGDDDAAAHGASWPFRPQCPPGAHRGAPRAEAAAPLRLGGRPVSSTWCARHIAGHKVARALLDDHPGQCFPLLLPRRASCHIVGSCARMGARDSVVNLSCHRGRSTVFFFEIC